MKYKKCPQCELNYIKEDEDPEIAMLEKILAEKKAKRKLQDSEM